jgi:hypothetical protein
MVLLVLSAMAATSKLLYPQINNENAANIAKRYAEISKYLLLNDGAPSDWGQDSQTFPETFGLANVRSDGPYDLDIDKVSRLNIENSYAVSYAQIFTALKMPDVSFRIEIKPIFQVAINLSSTFETANQTIYPFRILTEKHGAPIVAELKCYVIAEDFLETYDAYASDGKAYVNITLSNYLKGPGLLVAFARAVSDSRIVSYGVYPFAHNSSEPKPEGSFLRLSPLNYTLDVLYVTSGTNLSNAYAMTASYSSTLARISETNQSVGYGIPHFLDPSPTVIAVTGRNSSEFFTEWAAYPEIPLQTGADFAHSTTLSTVFVDTYIVSINSALYECAIWLGGPKE